MARREGVQYKGQAVLSDAGRHQHFHGAQENDRRARASPERVLSRQAARPVAHGEGAKPQQ
eukprot:CAMPEP_0177678190 /NCGR_PEP_ID=MMETSP0447-20121125/28872_1 /TAXON_ID=0 /ORGANISM="Stygamoeba regulata, Strain BSH-02190019" /LENGTH=60 /DNA_ID=CAMNT_0019187167 /DNA_START=97 /DNA_END=275 /DNA_ORIENTATION=+